MQIVCLLISAEHSVKRHYGISTKGCKLIHYYDDIDEWEMYDLRKGPQEMKNVHDDPDYTAKRGQMHRKLKKLHAEYGNLSF